jgi:carboxyvinyl-carboxyphosphonate phosphorylmutase
MIGKTTSTGLSLKELVERQQGLLAPGAFDMISARIIEQLGFEAVYFTGYGHAASHLGAPDVGLITMTEMVARVHNMATSVSIPVVADADTGFGNVINVIRTVREYEQAGAAAIQIEDQVFPKKCGHTQVRDVISPKEMAGKIEAATDARSSDGFLIIARTDALGIYGVEEAIRRGQLYRQAGADLVFVEAPRTAEQLKQIGEAIDAPLMANMVEGGKTPVLPFQELVRLGFKLVIYPGTAHRAAAAAVRRVLTQLRTDGISLDTEGRLMESSAMNALLGFDKVYDLEDRYGVG